MLRDAKLDGLGLLAADNYDSRAKEVLPPEDQACSHFNFLMEHIFK